MAKLNVIGFMMLLFLALPCFGYAAEDDIQGRLLISKNYSLSKRNVAVDFEWSIDYAHIFSKYIAAGVNVAWLYSS